MTLGAVQTQPIVAQVVSFGARALPTAQEVISNAYGVVKGHVLLTAAVAAPLAAYGLLSGKAWARWAGVIGLGVAYYQYRQMSDLDQQRTRLQLEELRRQALATGQ
jgi:hypothetical protein